jgi:glycine dehydrogenase subunit 1
VDLSYLLKFNASTRRVEEPRTHPYLPTLSKGAMEAMLAEIGVTSIEELFSDVPEDIRLKQGLALPGPLSELEVRRVIEGALERNIAFGPRLFLGAGCWPHYVPAAVEQLIMRGEFLTAYTPYQSEVNQGILQALFEYQSLVCDLTAMDYANSSLYDWASALGEAARMAFRFNRRRKILVPSYIGPERKQVLELYAEPLGMKIVPYRIMQDGNADLEDLGQKLDDETSCVYLENPSFLGFIVRNEQEVAELAHRKGALFIAGFEPISLALIKPPGEMGADIAVGEGQPLGLGMYYGGALLGIIACRGQELLRQMPGRIVGTTLDQEGRLAFTLVLQTREQHIRREKATSNITTNQALLAIAAAIYLSLLGREGLRKLAKLILGKTSYALSKVGEIDGVRAPLFDAPHFKDFEVGFTHARASEVRRGLRERGIEGGLPLTELYPELGEAALFCVTEVHSKQDIDLLCSSLQEVVSHV